MGIDAVVALTGDKVAPGSHAEARSVHDVNVFGLLRIIGELNRGDTGEGKRALKEAARPDGQGRWPIPTARTRSASWNCWRARRPPGPNS